MFFVYVSIITHPKFLFIPTFSQRILNFFKRRVFLGGAVLVFPILNVLIAAIDLSSIM